VGKIVVGERLGPVLHDFVVTKVDFAHRRLSGCAVRWSRSRGTSDDGEQDDRPDGVGN
jgi:hypothetical protein